MQKKEIVDEVERVVIRESDRIIKSVMAGPHEKILDTVSGLRFPSVIDR